MKPEASRQVDELRDEIAHTRSELGETVQELAARADVRSRARDSARRTAKRVRNSGIAPGLIVTVTAGLAAVVLLLVARRRRR